MDCVNKKYDPDSHRRRSIRLKNFNYSRSGLYFITICTQDHYCLFGEIKNEAMILNDAGGMIQTVWQEIPTYYKGFDVEEFVVMPNHFHGIIIIKHDFPDAVGAGPCACPVSIKGQPQGVAPTDGRLSLSDLVHRFKRLTTKRYTDGVKINHWQRFKKRLWQRNYYEHIIRSEEAYLQIFDYIQTNPKNGRKINTMSRMSFENTFCRGRPLCLPCL